MKNYRRIWIKSYIYPRKMILKVGRKKIRATKYTRVKGHWRKIWLVGNKTSVAGGKR